MDFFLSSQVLSWMSARTHLVLLVSEAEVPLQVSPKQHRPLFWTDNTKEAGHSSGLDSLNKHKAYTNIISGLHTINTVAHKHELCERHLTAPVVFLGISIWRKVCDDSVILRWRVSIPLLKKYKHQGWIRKPITDVDTKKNIQWLRHCSWVWPPWSSWAIPQVLHAISAVRGQAVCGQRRRGGRRRNAVLGDRLVAEEVSGEKSQQSFGELRAQTVVDVRQHSGNRSQEPAAMQRRNCQIHICCASHYTSTWMAWW